MKIILCLLIKKLQDDHIKTSVNASKVASLTMKYQASVQSSKQYTTFSSKSITFMLKDQAANAHTTRKDQCLYTPTMTEFNAVYSAVVSLLRIFASKMFAD